MPCQPGACVLAHGFDERNLVDLLQRGQAGAHFVERGLTQETHALFPRRAADLRARLLGENHLPDAIAQIQQFVDGGAAAVSRPGAFDAALAFVEHHVTPLGRIQAAGLEHVGRVAHGLAAVVADQAHQSLRQDAVERGDEVVGLHAHVQEASDHVHHVVGVYGGEHQVAGERRLDGDLRGFRIANFSHHDLVGIVAQNGAQPAGEGQPFFFIDRDLRDAADLVLDRIFDSDDLVFVGLDLVDGGVERGGLAAARRPGDQHHAVGLSNVAPEALEVVVAETHHVEHQRAELLAHGLFVQHAQYGVLAVNGGHDGHAEVDLPPVVLDAEAAVLRDPALGNVQLAHDLNAGDDGGLVLAGDRVHGLLQHAVNAVLDHHRVVAALDMDVAGPALQSGEDGGVHQANDGADVAFGGQPLDGDGFVAARLVFADDVQGEAFAGFFQHALRLFRFLEDVADLRQRADLGDDALAQQQADLVNHHQLAGIGNGNRQPPVRGLVQGDEVVAEHQVHGNLFEQVMVELEVPQIHELAAISPGDIARAALVIRGGVGGERSAVGA